MDNDQSKKLYEQMWQRRQRVMDDIARKGRRREQDAIFRTLMNKKGDANESKS